MEEIKEEKIAIAKIPYWVEKGKTLIYPERLEEWEKCVESVKEDYYNGKHLDDAIAIMEKLESGATFEEVIELFKSQNHSGAGEYIINNIIFEFSKKGPEFYEHAISEDEMTPENKEKVEAMKKENAELYELHKNDFSRENEESEIEKQRNEKQKLEKMLEEVEKLRETLYGRDEPDEPEELL